MYLSSSRVNSETNYFYEILYYLLNIEQFINSKNLRNPQIS
jgi:hypothetical protein